MVQMLLDLVVVGLVVRVLLDAVRRGLDRRDREADGLGGGRTSPASGEHPAGQ